MGSTQRRMEPFEIHDIAQSFIIRRLLYKYNYQFLCNKVNTLNRLNFFFKRIWVFFLNENTASQIKTY